LRLAVAGLGSAALRGHVPAIQRSPGLRVVAAADHDQKRRAVFGGVLSGVPVFDRVETMLDAVKCDALLVTASPEAHASLVAAALERGLHVICEKPLVLRPEEHHELARLAARTPAALISVHQYRCAGPWRVMAGMARTAARLRQAFALRMTVRRPGPDPLAATGWRSELGRFGGILVDHGVHYLALAWTIDERLDVLAADRTTSINDERCDVFLGLGAGTTRLRLESGSSERSTRVALTIGRRELTWDDQGLTLTTAGRHTWQRRVDGLASRVYIDGLYVGFYREVARRLGWDVAWHARRTAETLVVSRALLRVLDYLSVAVET
jgi:predicted dehydrogenase